MGLEGGMKHQFDKLNKADLNRIEKWFKDGCVGCPFLECSRCSWMFPDKGF